MVPFPNPTPVITGLKERIDALTVYGDRLYAGTSGGNLQIYSISGTDNVEAFKLLETRNTLVKRSIEELGFIKPLNSLVVLSESTVTLFPVPTLSPPTPLVKAKSAFSFAIHTSVQDLIFDKHENSSADSAPSQPIPALITRLIVGCRRKVVIYSWRDGEALEPQEAPLPHSARIISFIDHDTACFAYSPSEYAIYTISKMAAVDITLPVPVATSSSTGAMGALTGLTGYMRLGAKPKPATVALSETEALISKETDGIIIGKDAQVARSTIVEWAAPPEELAFIKPYIFAVLPAGSVPTQPAGSTQTFIPTSVLQIRSALSLLPTQNIPFPFTPLDAANPATALPNTAIPNATIRLLTPSSSKLFFLTTPTDKTTAATEGSTIWQCTMRTWADQIDELVQASRYADALALLGIIDDAILPDKETRRTQIRILNAVSDFREFRYDAAMDTFLALDLNPAKVVALYPENVSGRLAVPASGWIPLFGGPSPPKEGDGVTEEKEQEKVHEHGSAGTDAAVGILSSSSDVARGRPGAGVGSIRLRSAPKEEGSVPPAARTKRDTQNAPFEALMRYLSDRRPKLSAALRAVSITPENQSHAIAPLSEVSVPELFALPNAPLSELTPQQLLRCAQIVDTALYKLYLVTRLSLLGSLCRLPNWCEVSEVEEDLRARKKFAELVDLYQGKKMHAKALGLLKQLGERESDIEDKLSPSIHYLQKLGPEYLLQIFESARWIFHTDANMAFEIFTSEDVSLPRQQVCNYLEKIDEKICARYLEFLIRERGEVQPEFHDQLAELYLGMTEGARRKGDEGTKEEMYTKLLKFIDTNVVYRPERLYGLLHSSDLYEARAILLGRLGRHEEALKMYVYKMRDYLAAEEHCKRFYETDTNAATHELFLVLLRLYLRPSMDPLDNLLTPALDLISRHNARLDVVQTLRLLPPLVSTQEVRGFLAQAVRREATTGPRLEARVVRQVAKSQSESVGRTLMGLQEKRVKITDSRICPQCHKRIGNSVIAVHMPRGEVTHYHQQCREGFVEQLKANRW